MPILTWAQNLVAIGAGFFIGLILSLAGGGGSALAIPVMIYVVGLKNIQLAMGTTVVAIAVTTWISVIPHAVRRTISWSTALAFTVPGFLGLFLGRDVRSGFAMHLLMVLLGCLMLFNAAFMAGTLQSITLVSGAPRPNVSVTMALGFLSGAMAGFFGIGGGFLILPSLIFSGLSLVAAVGNSLVSVGSLSIVNAIPYAIDHHIDWRIVAEYIVGGSLGTVVRAPWAKKIGQTRTLSWMVALILVVASLYMIGINVPDLYT